MPPRASRGQVAVATALLLPFLVLSLALLVAPHGPHHGPFDKECPACRCSVDNVAALEPPPSLPDSLAPAGVAPAAYAARPPRSPLSPGGSRGPPRADA